MKLLVAVTLVVLLVEEFHCAPIIVAYNDEDGTKYIETIETDSWGYSVGGHLNLGVNAGFKDGKLSLGTENDIGANIGGHKTKSTKRSQPPTSSNGNGNQYGYNPWWSYGQPTGQYYGQYYQPTGPQYPQPAWPYYGQPAGQQYGQPAGQPYVQPAGQQYGQPAGQPYGQPAWSQNNSPPQPRQPAIGYQTVTTPGPQNSPPAGHSTPAPGGQNIQATEGPFQ